MVDVCVVKKMTSPDQHSAHTRTKDGLRTQFDWHVLALFLFARSKSIQKKKSDQLNEMGESITVRRMRCFE
jgi:hypothetical protein